MLAGGKVRQNPTACVAALTSAAGRGHRGRTASDASPARPTPPRRRASARQKPLPLEVEPRTPSPAPPASPNSPDSQLGKNSCSRGARIIDNRKSTHLILDVKLWELLALAYHAERGSAIVDKAR